MEFIESRVFKIFRNCIWFSLLVSGNRVNTKHIQCYSWTKKIYC